MGLDAKEENDKERNAIYKELEDEWEKIETSKGAITTTFVKRHTNLNSTYQSTIEQINQSEYEYQKITNETKRYFNDLVKKLSKSKDEPRLVISVSKFYPEVYPQK